jgi:hypothetical protein
VDPLSDVLVLLKPSSYRAGGFDLGGDFAIKFPKHESIKCYAVVSGQCWLSVEGVPDAVRLTAGDCFLLPRALPSCLASDLKLEPVDTSKIFPFPLNGRIASCNGGGDWLLVGGNFVLNGKACRYTFGGAAAYRAYPERIGEGGDTLVSGAIEGGAERSATRRFSCRTTTRLPATGSGPASSSGRRVEMRRRMVLRSIG